MARHLIAVLTIACLLASCEREPEARGADANRGDQASKRTARTVIPTGDRSTPGKASPVANPYAEKNWPPDEEVVNEWTREFDAAGTPAERIAVVERKQASGPELLAPLIRRSLREPDELVRTEAVKMLTSFVSAPEETGEVVDLVVGATHDPSSEVRILAMEAARELRPETQIAIYEKTIAGPYHEVRKMTIVELGRMMSKPAFDVLITGLKHPDPDFRNEVNLEIGLLVHRKFESFAQAKDWWDGNIGRYGENMVEIGGNE